MLQPTSSHAYLWHLVFIGHGGGKALNPLHLLGEQVSGVYLRHLVAAVGEVERIHVLVGGHQERDDI